MGGGLFIYVNTPKVNNCEFLGNGDNSTDKGGAVFAVSDKEDSDFSTRDDYFDSDSLENAEGELDLSNNTFLGNDATQIIISYLIIFLKFVYKI